MPPLPLRFREGMREVTIAADGCEEAGFRRDPID